MRVLERQRAMQLQQLHQNAHHCIIDETSTWPPVKIDPFFVDQNLPSFSLYAGQQHFPLPSSVTNSCSFSQTIEAKESLPPTRKRKAKEFDQVEEECVEEKGMEGEAQSEITVKSERESSSNDNNKEKSSSKGDYIHVRARRGQATDSHSLAERARREKISKKMRCLQDLVPGCNKVTGKAGMLDEIINYVQSLQKQVEFLSMKLAASNPKLDFNVDNLIPKEFTACMVNFPAASTTIEIANSSYFQLLNPTMQQGAASSCSVVDTMTNGGMPQRRDASSSIPFLEAYLDSSSSCAPPQLDNSLLTMQQPPTWETDWQNLYNNLNFH